MAQLINGLQIDIEAEELKRLLLGRLAYHEGKVAKYEEQHKSLAAIDKELDEEAEEIGKYTSKATAAQAMAQTIKSHRDQLVYYRFMVDHIVLGATYRLQEQDLVRIGVRAAY